MIKLKSTEEWRVNTEDEAKTAMENFRQSAATEGYEISSIGYTFKQKKAKGDIIDEAYVIKVVKKYASVFDI